eukprot:TRINITY_DN15888_c0_g1_i1.p1 TRINITY_DN15888_c0_g1~~TRINITY_DN15888_c0_g1_i1.p1  ORF type:complete len:962 (+),score=126.59 TRINITY_DN15888_c0_g1_i1:1162-4047(+)
MLPVSGIAKKSFLFFPKSHFQASCGCNNCLFFTPLHHLRNMRLLCYVTLILCINSVECLVRSFLNSECIGEWEAKNTHTDTIPCYQGEWSREITNTECVDGIYRIIVSYFIERHCYQDPVDVVEFIHDGVCRSYFDFGSKTTKWYIATTSSITCTNNTKSPDPINILDHVTTINLNQPNASFDAFRIDVMFHFSGRAETVLSGGLVSTGVSVVSLQTSYTAPLSDIVLIQVIPSAGNPLDVKVAFERASITQQHYEGTVDMPLLEFHFTGSKGAVTLHSSKRSYLSISGKKLVGGGLSHDVMFYSSHQSMITGDPPTHIDHDVNHVNQQPVSPATPYVKRSGEQYAQTGNFNMQLSGFVVLTQHKLETLTLRIKAPPKSILTICRNPGVRISVDENIWTAISIPLSESDVRSELLVISINTSLSVNATGGYPLQLQYDVDGSGNFEIIPRHRLFSLESDFNNSGYSTAIFTSSMPERDTVFTFETRDTGHIDSLFVEHDTVLDNQTKATYYFGSPADVMMIRMTGGSVDELRLTRGEVSVLFRRADYCYELLFPVDAVPESGGLVHIAKYYGWLRSMVWIPFVDGDLYDKSNVNQVGDLITSNGVRYSSTDNVAIRMVGIINTTQLFNGRVSIRVSSSTETIVQIGSDRFDQSDFYITRGGTSCPYLVVNVHYFQTAGPTNLALLWNNTAKGYYESIPKEYLMAPPLSVFPTPTTTQPPDLVGSSGVSVVIDLYTSRIELVALVEGLLDVYAIFKDTLEQSTCIDIQTIVKTNDSHWDVNGLFSCEGVAVNGRGVNDSIIFGSESEVGFYSKTAWKVRFSGMLKLENTTILGSEINEETIRKSLSPQLSAVLGESLVYVNVSLDSGDSSSSSPDPLVTALVLSAVFLIVAVIVIVTYFCCLKPNSNDVQDCDDVSVSSSGELPAQGKEVVPPTDKAGDVKEASPGNPLSVTSVRSVSSFGD